MGHTPIISVWHLLMNLKNNFFSTFTPLLTPKINKLNKFKKTWRCYPITHAHHKWRYDVWFLRYKASQSFLSFWAIFCPLTLLTTWKTKILKKWKKKKHVEISQFYTSVYTKNHDHQPSHASLFKMVKFQIAAVTLILRYLES